MLDICFGSNPDYLKLIQISLLLGRERTSS